MTTPEKKHHFDIHASVVYQLGESLISDVVQALVELIKNSYDADANYCKVTIVTTTKNDFPGSNYPDANGYVSIEDNGFGMNAADIERGWLTISNSLKRDMKYSGTTTRKHRTPLGDKGLGRLGTQRLGNNLEIFTRPSQGNTEFHVAFQWTDFRTDSKLSKIPIDYQSYPAKRKTGTTILISDLRDPESWSAKDEPGKLKDELPQMISPYKNVQNFRILLTIDGAQIDFASFTDQILNSAQIRYTLSFKDDIFKAAGKVRLSFIRPQDKEDIPSYRMLVEKDRGQQFFNYLCQNSKLAQKLNLHKADEEGWFIAYDMTRPFTDMDSLEKIDGKLANPGPFSGEIDSFDLGTDSTLGQNIFDKASEYKKYIKNLSGIRVYRDGFRIRLDQDWLGLGKQWTSATSYYGLKPMNTIGYIALSAKDNRNLEETTDREGFKVSPYYLNFFEILRQFIKFTQQAQQALRRGWIDFRAKNTEESANLESDTTPDRLAETIVERLSEAKSYRPSLVGMKDLLSQTESYAQRAVTNVSAELKVDLSTHGEIRLATKELLQAVEKASRAISSLDSYMQDLSSLQSKGEVLRNQVNQLHTQLSEVYETVSLGLTAEALSHEIKNVADRLAKQTYDIRKHIMQHNHRDAKLIEFAENVATSVAALRKQLSHLAPSLKYVREKKERISLLDFFTGEKDFYSSRFNKSKIELRIKSADNFVININRGKLTQITDNIFLNSQYWLREDMRRSFIEKGLINVELQKPLVRIWDNGRGIDPFVEMTLFEPFVTTKGRDKGRGLGLFIVQQLLDSEGCFISLLPERNRYNRRYSFELDLSGGINGDD